MNFEEYIKKPFEDQEFEYKEAYWQSAEKLIDNHYKRIRWIRAGIISSIIIATFIVSYFFVKTNETNLPNNTSLAQEPVDNQINTAGEHSTLPIQSPASEENPTLLNTDSSTSESVQDNQGSGKSEASITFADSNIAASLSDNTNSSNKNTGSKEAKARKNAPSNVAAKSVQSSSKEAAISGKKSPKTIVRSEKEALSDKKSTVVTNVSAVTNKGQSDLPGTPEGSNTERIDIENTTNTIALQSTSTIDLPFRKIEGANSLQLLNFPLHLDFGTKRPIIALPRPARMYANTEMLMYPSGNSEAFKFLGFNAGIGYQQPLGKIAFLDMGISGSFRRGNFAPSIVSTQLNYDFGPRTDAYILRPQSLFSLQVPVLLGVESGRHMLAAGVKLGFLIGVRGTTEYANYTHDFESPTGKESYSYDVVEEGWIESSGFRKFALAYALKYQYRLNSRIMIGASLQYLPSDWISNDFGKYYNFTSNEYQNPTGNPAQLIERNWLLGVELKYVLFSKS